MSKLESELEVQLKAGGFRYAREFVFVPGRRFRADFIVRAPAGKDRYEIGEVEGFPTMNGQPMTVCVLVEVQGFSPSGHHGSGFSQAHSDAEKLSLASCLGYRMIHATGKQVRDGSCLAWIRVALGLAGVDTISRPTVRRAPRAATGRQKRKVITKTLANRAVTKLPERVRRAAGL